MQKLSSHRKEDDIENTDTNYLRLYNKIFETTASGANGDKIPKFERVFGLIYSKKIKIYPCSANRIIGRF